MSKHKNDTKEFGARDIAKCFVFMAVGLFVAGAGFGGCVVCSVALDSIDAPESVLQETAWNLFREMRKIVHQYAPRFA